MAGRTHLITTIIRAIILRLHKLGCRGGYVHPGLCSELPVDIALGVADTIDVMSQNA